MVSIDSAKSNGIEDLCRKYRVRSLKLFGSATTGEFDVDKSDIDLLVQFEAPPPGMRLGFQFFGLLAELKELFGREVDMLEEPAIENSVLRRSVSSRAVTLYAA